MIVDSAEDYIYNNIISNTCLTIVGISGSGKSNILKNIVKTRSTDKRKFIYIDLTSIFHFDTSAVVIAISLSILNYLHNSKIIGSREYERYETRIGAGSHLQIGINVLAQLIEQLPLKSEYFLIIDHFDSIIKNKDKINLDIFKFIRSNSNVKLQYLFATENINFRDILDRSYLNSLSDLLSHKITYLPIGLKSETWIEKTKELLEDGYSEEEIYKITGGYTTFKKVLNASRTLEVNAKNKDELLIAINKLFSSLSLDQIELLKKVNVRIHINKKSADLNLLKTIGLVKEDKAGELHLFSEILNLYFSEKSSNPNDKYQIENLTRNESIIFDILFKNKGQLITKDQIAKELWGNESHNKYSNWAIDQTVKRLRLKVSKSGQDYSIITKRGRGLILN